LGAARRAGAGLGSARRTTAAGCGTATAAASATTSGDRTQLGSAGSDMGRPGNLSSACGTNRPGGSDIGRCAPSTTATASTRAIVGRTRCCGAGRTAGPYVGLAGARAEHLGAASSAVMGCAQARSATPAGSAVMGQ
jgi:hypothetical protein